MGEFDPAALERAWRRSGMSVIQLARAAGVTRPQYVRRWMRGQMAPSPTNLRRLADALGVAAHELTTSSPEDATIRDLRVWAGHSQRSLAAAAGLPLPHYVSVEQARQHRTLRERELVEALSAALEQPPVAVEAALARTRQRHSTPG